jgi:hypothetical protein
MADLLALAEASPPGMTAGFRYLADKLRQAQVFVLSDHGQLLDRAKPRPQVPGDVFRPPFPVVALEYTASTREWADPFYNGSKCSRRIALAWEWSDDLPPILRAFPCADLGAGVVVAALAFYDEQDHWLPVAAAMHLDFEETWNDAPAPSPFREAMIKAGRISKAVEKEPGLASSPIALMPEAIEAIAARMGAAATIDAICADMMDEVNAYTDLCYALACGNVGTSRVTAPPALNKKRIKAGKLPLRDFHVLELAGGGVLPGASDHGGGDRAAPRSHLRRGHIRRLGPERITWVNSAIVRGRGFIDKVYAA